MNIMTQLAVSGALDTSHLGVKFPFKAKYGNFINGQWEEPRSGKYFDNPSPITGEIICQIARSNEEDVNLALDAAHAAKDAWGKSSTTERSNMLLKIAQIIEDNLQLLAAAETIDNGKPIRESINADMALTVDHFRYLFCFAWGRP